MGFVRFLLWTAFCIGFGVFLTTYEVNGQTPWSHLQRMWSNGPHASSSLTRIRRGMEDAWNDARGASGRKALRSAPSTPSPKEHHSDEDRAALNRLVTQKAK